MTKARDLANSADVFDTVSTTELGYLDGVTSAVQTQIDSKLSNCYCSHLLIRQSYLEYLTQRLAT